MQLRSYTHLALHVAIHNAIYPILDMGDRSESRCLTLAMPLFLVGVDRQDLLDNLCRHHRDDGGTLLILTISYMDTIR